MELADPHIVSHNASISRRSANCPIAITERPGSAPALVSLQEGLDNDEAIRLHTNRTARRNSDNSDSRRDTLPGLCAGAGEGSRNRLPFQQPAGRHGPYALYPGLR